MGFEVSLLCFSFTILGNMKSSLLDDIVRDWEDIQLPMVKMSAGFILSQ